MPADLSVIQTALEAARAELAFCYESLGPLLEHRDKIPPVLELLESALEELGPPARCLGTRWSTMERCPNNAVKGGIYCQRHLGAQRVTEARTAARQARAALR